jgi:hypothetical protein
MFELMKKLPNIILYSAVVGGPQKMMRYFQRSMDIH